jgi:hypothetical protein
MALCTYSILLPTYALDTAVDVMHKYCGSSGCDSSLHSIDTFFNYKVNFEIHNLLFLCLLDTELLMNK